MSNIRQIIVVGEHHRQDFAASASAFVPRAAAGGSPIKFAPIIQLYKRAAKRAGHDLLKLTVATHSHGFIADTTELAADTFFLSTQQVMNVLGRERGWGWGRYIGVMKAKMLSLTKKRK